nr:MAG TPA: hypothetical protein [Caudoviricetes sp.]
MTRRFLIVKPVFNQSFSPLFDLLVHVTSFLSLHFRIANNIRYNVWLISQKIITMFSSKIWKQAFTLIFIHNPTVVINC